MKAVPILILTNALALALVIVLFVQQDELEAQLSSDRSAGDRPVATDTVGLHDRIARLEARLATRNAAGEVPAVMPRDDSTMPMADAAGKPIDRGTDAESGLDGAEMDSFRGNVRKALELNREEDQVTRVVDRLDKLVGENKIASLSEKQKKSVARIVLSSREKMPQIWRQMRNPEVREMSREDRRAYITAEFDSLRAEAQTSLENIVPAADAKTIVEETRAMGGDRGFMRGGATPRRANSGGTATNRRAR